MENNDNLVTLLNVSFDNNDNTYKVMVPKGSNAAETAFCIAVLAKVFVRDGIIKNAKELLDAVNKYIDDPQFEEVKKDG